MARAVVASLVAGLLLGATAAATADDRGSSTQRRLEDAQQRVSEAERRIEQAEQALEASQARLAELSVELDAASAQLADRVAAEQAAERAAATALARAERADADVRAAERELEAADAQLQDLVWHTYVHGRTSAAPFAATLDALSSGGGQDLAERLHYLQRTVGAQAAVLETSAALTVQLEGLRERARVEHAQAQAALAAVSRTAEEAAAAHARVLQLADEASAEHDQRERRLDELTRERDRLAAEADGLRARLAAEEEEARRRAEAEERRRAEVQRRRAAPSRAAGPGGRGLVTVGGITVAASIGPDVEALLAAARADGIVLGGMGYRSPEVTAQLRRANGCPDVYDSPASACRIPTARPGTSEHEKGLAIDFTWQGQTICFPRPASRCSGNAAFDWLEANAATYGLYNLPSEAWHWSTTGR